MRTIDVHGAFEHGAVPRTNASCVETNVTDVAVNPVGTGPPAGTDVAGAVDGAVAVGVALAVLVVGVGAAAGVVLVPLLAPECAEPQPDTAKIANRTPDRSASPGRDVRNGGRMGSPLSPPVTGSR
ncbi:hypothetical protein [Trebonia sp.]|uniref:hypothetical protein n=1 Tax=Trebonia sp. TaxID=2767075 RepID=UPI00262B02E5|nr:hypothetical protein [Trebonia sp.]